MKRFFPVFAEDWCPARGALPMRHLYRDVDKMLTRAGVEEPDFPVTSFLRSDELFDIASLMARADYESAGMPFPEIDWDLSPIFSCTQVLLFWHHIRWQRHGRPIFDLDANLARAFLETEIRLKGHEVTLPLASFYLAVPPELELKVWNDSTGWHPLDGFYVSLQHPRVDSPVIYDMTPGPNARPGVRSYVDGPEGFPETVTIPLGHQVSLGIVAIGLPRPGMAEGDDAIVHFSVPLALDGDLEDVVANDPTLHGLAGVGESIGWVRLILNTALYLVGDEPDCERERFGVPAWAVAEAATRSKKQQKKHLDRHARHDVTYSVVGRKLQLDDATTRHFAEPEEQRRLSKRFMVRGHWRMQAHGVGRLLRRPVWIKPHFVGPSWAEVTSSTRIQRVTLPENDEAP